MLRDAAEEGRDHARPRAGVAVEDDRDEVGGDEVGLVPEGTDTVPAAAVSGAAEHVAPAGAPQEEGFVLLHGPPPRLGEVRLPRDACPLRLARLGLDEGVQGLERLGRGRGLGQRQGAPGARKRLKKPE